MRLLHFAIDAVFEELHSTAAHFRRVRVTEQWQIDLSYDVRPDLGSWALLYT